MEIGMGPPEPVPVEARGWGAKPFWLQGKGGGPIPGPDPHAIHT